MKRQLILENGDVFVGEAFGSSIEKTGEVVFNTGMTGYQEILSDPSYCDQIITMTYPLIGNYGINRDDFESVSPAIAGFIVKEATDIPSHWRSEKSLHDLLADKNIPGLQGVDTRSLTRIIRQHGTLKGRLCNMDVDAETVIRDLQSQDLPHDQVSRVSTKVSYFSPGNGPRIVLVDFGAKRGILRECIERHFNVIVAPYNITAEEIRQLQPDGILLSNGPGDPKDVPEAIEMVKEVMVDIPLFGICLGHQLLALANGADTEKMRFGHRGSNHPVMDHTTGKFVITSQNHGFTVKNNSLENTGLYITHTAINDGTIEGLAHQTYPAFSVQFHPEATPGPVDTSYLFDKFASLIEQHKKVGMFHA